MKESRKNIILEEIKNEPENPFNHYLLALEYYAEQDFEQANKQFKQLLDSFPNYLPCYYTFAEKLIEQKTELTLAEEIIEKGLKIAQDQENKKAQRELQALLDINF